MKIEIDTEDLLTWSTIIRIATRITVCYDDTPQTALNGLYELLIDALTTGNMKMYANLIPEIKIKRMTAEITLSASQNMTLDVFLDGNEEKKE